MPIYGYVCARCEHRFELRQPFDAASEMNCPKCGSPAQRKIYPVGIIFKGNGWYTTDYAKKTYTGPSEDGPKESPKKEEEKKAPEPSPASAEKKG
ncbi:MAG: zinc ribbon domain-containing protein [Chloroflexi bacterium]|nr:zinc ribbon domain-containing protein [Chloroflexota bacterium]